MSLVPQTPEYHQPDAEWRANPHREVNPIVVVSSRVDRVLLGPDGREISRIVDRPIGFGPSVVRGRP